MNDDTDTQRSQGEVERVFEALEEPAARIDPPAALLNAVRTRIAQAMADDAAPLAEELRRRLPNIARATEAPVEPAASERVHRPVIVVTGADDPGGSLTPALHVHDVDPMVGFLADAFDATLTSFRPGADGTIAEVRLVVGGSTLLLVERPGQARSLDPTSAGGATATMHLEVDDVDATVERAIAAGALALQTVREHAGTRSAVVEDPAGHHWVLTGRPRPA